MADIIRAATCAHCGSTIYLHDRFNVWRHSNDRTDCPGTDNKKATPARLPASFRRITG